MTGHLSDMTDLRCPAPTCRALPGEPCVSLAGFPRKISHKSRRNLEAIAGVDCRCGAQRGEPCVTATGLAMRHVHQQRREHHEALRGPKRAEQPDLTFWLDKFHCGDALDTLRAIPDQSVDLGFTSPPYNALETTGGGWRNGLGKWQRAPLLKDGYAQHSDRMPPDDYIAWQQECLRELMRVVKDDGAILYNHRPRVQGDVYEDHARDIIAGVVGDAGGYGFELRQVILWDRGGGFNHNAGYFLPAYEEIFLLAKPGRFRHKELGRIHNVFRVKPDRKRGLPALPVDLARIPLAALRPDFGETPPVVLDPFMGSGSVAEAAVREDWRYVGIDISDEYCRQARNRIAKALVESEDSQGDDSHDDSQPDDSQGDDSQPEDSQGEDSQGDDSQTKSADLLESWLAVPVRWNDLDKKVYDHIVALQADSKLQAVPLDQKEMATLFKYGPRKVNESIAKLKSAGAITVKRQRGPSLYSASSEIPRWPVRIAGGIGTPSVEDSHVDDSQPEDSHDDSQMPAGPGIEINQSRHILEDLYIPGPAGMPILSHDSQGDDSQTRPTATCERCGPNSLVESVQAANQGLHGLYHCAGQKGTCSYLYDAEIGVELRQPYTDELSIPDAIDLCRRSREAHAGRWPTPPPHVNPDSRESGNDERFAEYREAKQRYDREVNNG